MTLKREETEIRNQAHEMRAEGTSDEMPTEADVESLLTGEGYEASNIEMWFDGAQGFYRWNCDIKPIAN